MRCFITPPGCALPAAGPAPCRAKKEVDYNEHSLFKHAEAALRQAEARPQR